MNYGSSKCGNIGCTCNTNDEHDERLPSEELVQVVHETHDATRNWAWAHNNDSYDWMDSHSPFNTQDSVH
ncbi:hypothetical protein [Paraburkholderia sp.]|uniref:hypothetical protein n=1 Tax=Paraburkholderia sp. TaxID=1926495 RepID=UPI003C7BD536